MTPPAARAAMNRHADGPEGKARPPGGRTGDTRPDLPRDREIVAIPVTSPGYPLENSNSSPLRVTVTPVRSNVQLSPSSSL